MTQMETLEQSIDKLVKTALKCKRDRDELLGACIAASTYIGMAAESQVGNSVKKACDEAITRAVQP